MQTLLRMLIVLAGKIAPSLVEHGSNAVDFLRFRAGHIAKSKGVRLGIPVAAIVMIAVFGVAPAAFAQSSFGMGDLIALVMANTIQPILSLLGLLLVWAVQMLVWVAEWDSFVTSPAVANGWFIIRDLANMFFIIALLVMAFSTILGISKYQFEPRSFVQLVISAVLVNFSRTIAGILIDASQVVMLTFVYGFREAAGGNFVEAFQITRLFEFSQENDVSTTSSIALKVLVSFVLGLILTLISLGVVVTMTMMLVVRVISLWVHVVISPLAFLPDSLPQVSGLKDTWWKGFKENLLFGPLMAFFLWLSLLTVGAGDLGRQSAVDSGEAAALTGGDIGLTEVFSFGAMQSFVFAIAFLVYGTRFAKQLAGSIANAVPAADDWVTGKVKGAAKWTAKKGIWAPFKATGRAAGFAYRSSGMEEHVVEKGLGQIATSGIPLVSDWALSGVAASRSARKSRQKKAADKVSELRATEKASLAKGFAITESGKAQQKQALKDLLEKMKKDPIDTSDKEAFNKFMDQKKKLEDKYGEDKDVKEDLKAFEKARAQFIIDPRDKGTERGRKQLERFRERTQNMSQAQLKDLIEYGILDTEYGDKVLMNASPKAVQFLQGLLTHSSLEKMGKDADEIKRVQEAMRRNPDNFSFLSEGDRAKAIREMSAGDVEKIKTLPDGSRSEEFVELMSPKVLAAAVESGKAKQVIDELVAKTNEKDEKKRFDPKQIIDNKALAREIGEALRDRDAEDPTRKALSPELETAIAGALEGIAPEFTLMMEGGDETKMKLAFGSHDYGGGDFMSAEGKKKFSDWLDTKDTVGRAQLVPAAAYENNEGVTITSLTAISKLTPASIKQMIKSGNVDQVTSILKSAQNVSNLEEEGVARQLGDDRAQLMTPEEITKAVGRAKKLTAGNMRAYRALGDTDYAKAMLEKDEEMREAKREAAKKRREEKKAKFERPKPEDVEGIDLPTGTPPETGGGSGGVDLPPDDGTEPIIER